MVVRLKVDSKALLKKLVERKMSVVEAAELMRMQRSNFSRYINSDKPIRPKTAGKLRSLFGDAVVYMAGD